MLANTLLNDKSVSAILQKGITTGLGFIMPLALLIGAMLLTGRDLISAYRLFATSITQGLFEEGWSIPFEYFWYTEYTIFLILGTLAIVAIVNPFKDQIRYTRFWAAGILFIYLCIVIPSLLEYFVVYARLARQMLPFLILLAAQGLISLENRVAYRVHFPQFIFVVIIVQAAWNYSAAYRVGFPRDFADETQLQFPGFEFSSKRLAYGAPVVCQHNGYVIENAKFYIAPPERVPQVQGRLLLSAQHPVNYLPYLYEGDPPDFRQAYRRLKLKMRFYKADSEFMSEANPEWTAIENCVVREN